MYAIFEDGGKQYKVGEGDNLLVERRELGSEAGSITFDRILMVGTGGAARVGQPWIEGASVRATVLEELKADKVTGIKFRRRKGYMKKFGHRQKLLKVRIDKIDA